MTELRRQRTDLSNEPVVPLQTDAASGPEEVLPDTTTPGARSLGSDAWRELRGRPMFWISLALILLFLVMAIFPELFTSKDPAYADLSKAREKPSADAWFGRDTQGYDVYARTIYGARASISVGILATILSMVLGVVIGIVSGYRGGWMDSVLGRIGEIFLAIPLLLGGILRLAYHQPADALQRAAGQAERLRAGGSGTGSLPDADHRLAHRA
jgi:oligopeptide transport system permease protein